MLKYTLIKKVPVALAITAAVLLGGVAHAQKNNMPAGTTKPQNNAVTPAPAAGMATNAAAPAGAGMSGSSSADTNGGIAGTMKGKENIANPSPVAGTEKSKEMHASKTKKPHRKSMRNKTKSSTNDMGVTPGKGTN